MTEKQKKLRESGYLVIKDIFNEVQIEELRNNIISYFGAGGGFPNAGGHAKPDWIKDDRCSNMMWLLEYEPLQKILKEYIGDNVKFLGHNDIHLNRVVGWHKDRLSGAGVKFEKHNPWSEVAGETHQIYKVNIYLQDHSKDKNDDFALAIKENTHKTEKDLSNPKISTLRPGLGDIVLFDQRITHRGQMKHYRIPRILISLGYGIPNVFAEEFEAGTKARQDNQNGIL
jgi:hypothetical protein